MKKYKLVSQDLKTYNGFQWEIGKKFTTSGKGELCGPGFLHYYHHPLLAVLLNPIHADLENPRLFEVEAEGIHLDDVGLKGGCSEMTLIKEIEIPKLTTIQITAFAILTSLEVYKNEGYKQWAQKWLSGEDRSKSAARYAAGSAAGSAARYAAGSAARSAAGSAARSAASAARSAAYAAESAAYAARSAAESAARSAAWSAAESAAYAAYAARSAAILERLIECAEKCLEY